MRNNGSVCNDACWNVMMLMFNPIFEFKTRITSRVYNQDVETEAKVLVAFGNLFGEEAS